jgi:type IV secretory pathway VirD2 relaxase
VAVKVRLVRLKHAGARSTITHLRYIERDGVSPTGEPGHLYSRDFDQADPDAFEQQGRGDRHQFRIIVAPEEGGELEDLRTYTRSLMAQVETDLGTELQWVAVDHWDTGHPHTHIVLRGKDQHGKDLVIARDYISHGLRARASEIATQWLGPRTEQEISQSLSKEMTQERWTSLDAALQRLSRDDGVNLSQLPDPWRSVDRRAALVGRLRFLEQHGWAEQRADGVWRVSPNCQAQLQQAGEREDVVRRIQRTVGGNVGDYQIFDPTVHAAVVGCVAGKGLKDELSDRGYLIVQGLDGKSHYASLGPDTQISEIPLGAIVEVSGGGPKKSDVNIARVAADGVYRVAEHRRVLQAAGIDPASVLEQHARRLEALRRSGIVTRLDPSAWKVPPDLVARGTAYDRQRVGGAEVRVLSRLPIERQINAIGATWLDQALVSTPALPRTSWGDELRTALAQRESFLVDQGHARRHGQSVVLPRNFLSSLRQAELSATARSLEASSGKLYRPAQDGARVSGTYRQSLQLVSGRYALLEDGMGFSLVPWKPVIEKRLGQQLTAVVSGGGVSWEIGRARSLGV